MSKFVPKLVNLFIAILIFFAIGCLEKKDTSVSRNILAGLDFMARDKYDEALKVFSKTLDKNSKNTDALFYRGVIYYKKGEMDKGISDFEKLFELDKNFHWEENFLWDITENVFNKKKDYLKAAAMYRFFIDKFPTSKNVALSYIQIANSSLRLKDFDQALVGYKKVINMFKNGKNKYEKNIAKQAEEVSGFIKDNSDYDRKPLYLYSDMQNEIDPVKKIEAGNKILKLYPKCNLADKIQYQIGRLYSVDGLNDFDQAVKEYQKLIDKYPNSSLVKAAQFSINGIKEKFDPETGKLQGPLH